MRLIGMDFEASGSDPWGRHAPIQLGMAYQDETFESLIGGWSFARYNGEWEWNEEAAQVHNIHQSEVAIAPRVHEVDVRAATWLYDLGLKSRMWNITVGWNVGGYDRQFITRHFPNLNRLLSYRTVDLNTLVFAGANGSIKEYKSLKAAAKDYANEVLGVSEEDGRHNALVDARAAVLEYGFLVKALRGES